MGRKLTVVLYENEYFKLYEENDKVLLDVYETGFSLKDFDAIIKQNSRIKLTSFQALRAALEQENSMRIEIGIWLPVLMLSVSKDGMSASLKINDEKDDLIQNEEQLNRQIAVIANQMGLRCELKKVTVKDVTTEKKIIIGEGIQPEKGKDAEISYFESPIKKPVIREDGRADYFDMNFICEIEKDQWLGEKVPATEGESGVNVFGEIVSSVAGKDANLKYDPNSIYESSEAGHTVLRAKHNGVLDASNGVIQLLQHLTINGDVGVETGNIDFKGSILIKGTVSPGFSVRALGDLSIEGMTGVTGAEFIESLSGDINIRGGVFGNGTMVVRSGKNIYAKHANDVTFEAMEDIYVSNYAMGSKLYAKNIYLDEHKGKIIGGEAEVTQCIKVAYSGNAHERITKLSVIVPDRVERMAEARAIAVESEELKKEFKKQEVYVAQLEPFVDKMNQDQRMAFENSRQQLLTLKKRILHLDERIQMILLSIRQLGKEEIAIMQQAYPGTVLQIGKHSTMLRKQTCGRFKVEGGELNV